MSSGVKFHKGSIVDLEDEIDLDVHALELAVQRSNFPADTDFVNLDQLGNTIATNKSSKDRKYAIDDILNQTVKHSKALECIDECIKLVITTWKIQDLKQKSTKDLYKLLQEKKYKMTIWQDIITYFYDKPSYICEKIILIAKRISAMKLILDHQNMVQLPNTPHQWSILLNRLKQKGQSLALTQRSTILEHVDDQTPITELKSDTESNEEIQMFAHVEIDDTVNGVTADDALQDILLKHRTKFTSTTLYKQMTGRTHNRGSSLVKSLFAGPSKNKSPSITLRTVENISEDKVVPADTNIQGIEMKPLTASGSDSDDEHKIYKKRHSASSSLVFNTDVNKEKLQAKWVNPSCAGCGDIIQISFDGKDAATKNVITYDCRFVEDLDESVSSLIYFHDKHCENLRKYKESIRKYVLDSQLPSVSRGKVNNMKNYVKNLLNHKDLLINIDSGELPRPGKILEREQVQFLSFITGGLFKQKGEKMEEEMNISIMGDLEKKEEKKLTLLEISKQRDIAVRLLTRGEIIQQTFKKSNVKIFHHFAEDDAPQEDEINGIFDDIPKILQYADSHIFGEPLFKFVVQQLLSKQTTALWRLLAYISMQLPTVHSISLLNEHQSDLAKAKKMEHLELVCTSIIQAAAYPIGTALHLSGFMSDLAENDLSREDDFRAVATRYINIAENLVEYIESDHLLALLLEVPTDIDQMNVFDIAIQFGLDDFFDNNRVDRVITHMHQQFDFLNPNKTFSTCEMSTYRLLRYMIESPSKFYYSPIGKWYTAAILYILYVMIVTIVCGQQNYLYTDITATEWIMWIANAGYITYEITEMLLDGFEYFSETSNFFDSIISINWFLLGFLRLLSPYILPASLIKGSADLVSRNKPLNVIYMLLFGIEMCLLYLRFAIILSSSRKLGPFIRMIITMIRDILYFSLIVVLLLTGFTFALSFVIGGDKDPSNEYCYDEDKDHSKEPLSSLPSIGLYSFQVLLGQQEWSVIAGNECLSPNRSRIVQAYIIILSILGTVLLLNLLIAMMASTYENRRQSTSKDVNFSRTQETYQLAHRNALIAAPFNIVAYVISLFFELITIIVIICSGGRYVFDIFSMVPVGINYSHAHTQNKSRKKVGKIKKNCNKIARCCCTFIRKVQDLAGDDDAPTSYVKNVYFNYGDGGRRFCRYCREYIGEQNGDISDYFELFIHYRLDEDDVKLMKRIMHGSGVCPTCYRPYKIFDDGKTDRLQRWEIQIEVISYYVFRIFVHIPMILILLLPALFGGLTSWITSIAKDSHKITSDDVDDIQNITTTDEHYRNLVQHVIQNELQQNIDVLSTQIDSLNKKFINISNQQKKYNLQLTSITNLLTSIDNKLTDNKESKQESKQQQKKKELGGLLLSEFHAGTQPLFIE